MKKKLLTKTETGNVPKETVCYVHETILFVFMATAHRPKQMVHIIANVTALPLETFY